MTGDADELRTGVVDAAGSWPSLPKYWSFSSLGTAAECPRQWSLARASYPGLWDRSGYPPKPNLSGLLGDVVHRALDLILQALCERECPSIHDASAVDALRQLGGYSSLVARLVDEQIDYLQENPRIEEHVTEVRSVLASKIPEIRQRVQRMMARATLAPVRTPCVHAGASRRGTLGQGSHTEVTLCSTDLRMLGRADLLTVTGDGCEIVDYKTGQPSPHHSEQLRLYALLWGRDVDRNPTSLPVTRLTLSYPTSDESVSIPTPDEEAELADHLIRTISRVEEDLQARPPGARPESADCGLCDVRQLCTEYWLNRGEWDGEGEGQGFVDVEGTVVSQNGPKSWRIRTRSGAASVLIRTKSETPGFSIGERVRFLDLLLTHDDDSGEPALCLTRSSEVFRLEES